MRSVLAAGIALVMCAGCGDSSDTPEPVEDNIAPVAVLSAPLRVQAGAPVLLDGSGSSDEDGEIEAYWFEPFEGGPVLQSVSPRLYHTFETPGVYTITLNVIDDFGSKDTDRSEITVE